MREYFLDGLLVVFAVWTAVCFLTNRQQLLRSY